MAVGSIMPAIIAAHIAQRRTSRGASQVTVIIQAEAPDIGPYISRAIAITQIQQARGMPTRTTARLKRGRWSACSIGVDAGTWLDCNYDYPLGASQIH